MRKKLSPREIMERSRAIATLQEGREHDAVPSNSAQLAIAPDYVSAETLAQRLDCSRSTVHGYVRRGILPRPIRIGELVRWRWLDVEKAIESIERGEESHANVDDDPYMQGLERGETEEASH